MLAIPRRPLHAARGEIVVERCLHAEHISRLGAELPYTSMVERDGPVGQTRTRAKTVITCDTRQWCEAQRHGALSAFRRRCQIRHRAHGGDKHPATSLLVDTERVTWPDCGRTGAQPTALVLLEGRMNLVDHLAERRTANSRA
jgi:hypothetical protein